MIEYRDTDGNLLNAEQVAALEGSVSFKTQYETRTRLVDEHGNEVSPPAGADGIAPPHPDVQGQNPETAGGRRVPDEAKEQPATADVEEDLSKERSVEQGKQKPRPGSEGNEATK